MGSAADGVYYFFHSKLNRCKVVFDHGTAQFFRCASQAHFRGMAFRRRLLSLVLPHAARYKR